MRFRGIAVSLILVGAINASAQQKLTKDEILESWSSSNHKANSTRDLKNTTFDQRTNTRINSFVDSLKQQNIDSIIIYSVSYPGYVSLDGCFEYLYPIYCYIVWPSVKELNIKLIKGKCEASVTKIDSSGIFKFYLGNKEAIQKEDVMPAILGAYRNEEDHIIYSSSIVSHEPKYSLYFAIDKIFKEVSFAENDIQNDESLFHQYNLNLKSIQLWKLIEKEIGGILSR